MVGPELCPVSSEAEPTGDAQRSRGSEAALWAALEEVGIVSEPPPGTWGC